MLINILLVSTLNYTEHLIPIIKSIVSNVKTEYLIHIYLVDVNEETKIKDIKNISEKIVIKHLNVNLKNVAHLRSYSANIRIRLINGMLNEGKDYILYLDVDSIVRKDIQELINNTDNYDLGLFITKQKDVKSGIILARNTNKSKIFFSQVEKSLNKFGLYKWYSDQESLKQIYHQILNCKYPVNEKPNILKIDEKYLDWNFLDTSVIWTGKGPRKYKNKKYLKDKNVYT